MLEYLILVPCIFFVAFLIPGRYREYFAALGWAGVVLLLFAGIPDYIAQNNFLYPLLAILSVPFLVITVKYLLRRDDRVMHLSRAAAVAFIIYVPFALIPAVQEALIGVVVGQTAWLIEAFGYPVTFDAWNIIGRNGFRTEIILACTGIQAIAIMLGVAAAVPTTIRQKVYSVLLIVPPIYVLNLFRNAAVIIAYTEQWFPWFPEIAGNGEYGYESFFWAHNVAAELLALVLLVAIAYGLFRLIPGLGSLAAGLFDLYRDEVSRWFNRTPAA